jgi:membrane-associated phospholipid phosphatase
LHSIANPVSGYTWFIAVIGAAILALFVCITEFSFDPDLALALCYVAGCAVIGLTLRQSGWTRAGGLLEAIAQFVLIGVVAPLLSIVLAATNLPYRDAELAAIDAWFGLDWVGLVRSAAELPAFMWAANKLYPTLAPQPLVLLLLLFLSGRGEIARLFLLAWAIALALTLLIFPFVPAVGGYLYFGIAAEEVSVTVPAAFRHVEILGPARDGAPLVLGLDTLWGIVTFPSFHAAASVLLAWAFAALPLLRWPAIGLNAGMFASSVFIGGHYLIDLVAGVMVACTAIVAANRLALASPVPVGTGAALNPARVGA